MRARVLLRGMCNYKKDARARTGAAVVTSARTRSMGVVRVCCVCVSDFPHTNRNRARAPTTTLRRGSSDANTRLSISARAPPWARALTHARTREHRTLRGEVQSPNHPVHSASYDIPSQLKYPPQCSFSAWPFVSSPHTPRGTLSIPWSRLWTLLPRLLAVDFA